MFFLFIQAGEGAEPFICKIVEMFEGADGNLYFTAQWFYRACDTVRIKKLFFFAFPFLYVESSDVLAFS